MKELEKQKYSREQSSQAKPTTTTRRQLRTSKNGLDGRRRVPALQGRDNRHRFLKPGNLSSKVRTTFLRWPSTLRVSCLSLAFWVEECKVWVNTHCDWIIIKIISKIYHGYTFAQALASLQSILGEISRRNNIFFIFPTTTNASPRQGTWMTRPDPWPQIECTLGSCLRDGAIFHWPCASNSTTLCQLKQQDFCCQVILKRQDSNQM